MQDREHRGTEARQLLEILAASADIWPPKRERGFLPTRRGHWFFVASLSSYILAIVSGIINIANQGEVAFWVYSVVGLLLVSVTACIGGLALMSFSAYKEIRSLDTVYQKDLVEQSEREVAALRKLGSYSPGLLKVAAERLKVERDQLRERFGYLVGSLEKLGMIPAIVPVGVSLAKVSEGKPALDHWAWAAIVVQAVYLLAFLIVGLMQKLEIQHWVVDNAGVLYGGLAKEDLLEGEDGVDRESQNPPAGEDG